MLFSRLSFLFVLLEWACIIAGYFAHSVHFLYNIFIFGSPIYMAMNLFTHGSALLETQPFFIGLLGFHLVKYAMIFKAQTGEDNSWLRLIAIVLEIAYVAFSGYLLY